MHVCIHFCCGWRCRRFKKDLSVINDELDRLIERATETASPEDVEALQVCTSLLSPLLREEQTFSEDSDVFVLGMVA